MFYDKLKMAEWSMCLPLNPGAVGTSPTKGDRQKNYFDLYDTKVVQYTYLLNDPCT